MIRRLTKSFIILLLILRFCAEPSGSNPAIDYSFLPGSGMPPQEYDILVKKRES